MEQQFSTANPTIAEYSTPVSVQDERVFVLVSRDVYPKSSPLLGYLYERNPSTGTLDLSATRTSGAPMATILFAERG
ncbi:MAG: hypothetical protein ACJAZ8_000954 [Planctomycetota bacterium]